MMRLMEPTENNFDQTEKSEYPVSSSEPTLPQPSIDSIGVEFVNGKNLSEVCLSLSRFLRHANFSWHALTNFTQMRVNRLAEDSQIADFSSGNFQGFFNPETVIRGGYWSLPLKLNDSKFFTESFISSCQRYIATNTSERGARVQAPLIAGGAVARYFNSYLSYDPNSERELRFSIDANIDLESVINLSDIRNKSWAAATERAPLYSQAMSLLGFDVTTCFGIISADETAGLKDHMFSVIKTDRGYSIHDIGHPVKWNHLNGHQQVYAAIFPIKDDQLKEFLAGQPVAFNHSEFNQVADNSFIANTFRRIYRLHSGWSK
jgi:hypothetical protein